MYKTELNTTSLGQAVLEIARIGFGAWAIGGGGWEFGWGPQDDEQSVAAIRRALERGVNWIDTAAAYGFGTLAEFKDKGLVRHIGVSNFDVEQLRRIQQIGPVETLQPEYSLIARQPNASFSPSPTLRRSA